MDPIRYHVVRIEGDYAILVPQDRTPAVEIPVALALLPDGVGEGTRLLYEELEYTIL